MKEHFGVGGSVPRQVPLFPTAPGAAMEKGQGGRTYSDAGLSHGAGDYYYGW